VRRALAAALAGLALSGCAGTDFVYERRNVTAAQEDRDLEICRREGFRPSRFAVRPSDRYDWDVVNRCMERRGYRVRPAE
jgi:hypothetical protein